MAPIKLQSSQNCQLHFTGGLPLPKANPTWLTATIPKISYDIYVLIWMKFGTLK